MPLPAGITTATVTFGKALGVLGTEATIDATVQIDRPVVWGATGDMLYPYPDPVSSGAGNFLSFQFPHVDQPGFVNEQGNAIVNFAGVLKAKVRFGTKTVLDVTKPFQVKVGQTNVDLDLVPGGSIVPEVSAPLPSVLSVAGETGNVDADHLKAAMGALSVAELETVLPAKMADPTDPVRTAFDQTAAQLLDDQDSAFRAKQTATVAAGVQSISGATFTRKTTLTPGRSGEVLAPQFVNHPHDLLKRSDLDMPSIATMRVICTDGIIADPLGRFYAYLSTDHDTAETSDEPWNGKGGIVLAYADHPTGPWTVHRDGVGALIIWQDTVAGNQTETPTPLYVPSDPAGKPIYVYYQNQGVGLNQSTLLARSATGRPEDFERVGLVVQGRGTTSPVWPGDGQSTYMEPMRLNGRIIAVHLMGGGDWAQYGRSYSEDGRNFVTDPRRFGHFSHLVGGDNARRASIRSLFMWRGSPWAQVTVGVHASGFVSPNGRQTGFVQLSPDLRRIVGRIHFVTDPAIGAGQVLEHEGRLYLFYRSGDAYSAFRCAIAEA